MMYKNLLIKLCLAPLLLGYMACSKGGNTDVGEKKEENPPVKESPIGDVVGQITTGYQGWFSCNGDKSPMGKHWWHWTHTWEATPNLENLTIKSWPDNREYDHVYPTQLPDLGNGQKATLFSSYDEQTVDVHFRWMKEYGIHTAALQRFNPNGVEGPIRDAITETVKKQAEKHGVKFYIMYDVSGWDNMQPEIKKDWTDKMRKYTASPQYAMQNGKPVVGIWGFGFNDDNHPWPADKCKEVIDWFKDQGCYVMGGVPTNWRLAPAGQDARPGFLHVYKAFDMLSPWMVGRIGQITDIDRHTNDVIVPDLKFCKENGIDYQPCVLPGDLQERQRQHGEFMWRQFHNYIKAEVRSLYISMYDEYNEGNQIAKTAETASDVPQGSNILALDEDGVACSADYYLRITQDAGRMLRKEIPISMKKPTLPKVD
ncbi:glycoside hydrolase family 71/99-like protein [Sphingobacterium sp. Mn56C]|uniref:glycoside hydrolase family 71/99-like protein n=1 Tax=Sphingobacterium sp. Mn56C TaxID=3395261 RepID=UPI003BDD5E64